ncbi:DNA helicase-2/ATP-dependent DNA helicase PcrA [Clostridium algifaecis]|uniref:DNA 3'-5' helicase n=1 Tax=Clostridium algifaecis TaxID=1472040 RepID=A0ABS4KT57_9CLOT|nr:ATP-dependent helicase [Clostridium algifaecis]MBP2033223.1 DNA helicase-2/ATP-dependent DNA helicase PcrA [Clostridium algifaecis]
MISDSAIEKLCFGICSKKRCPKDIFKCDGIIKDKCIERGKSCIENLNENQIEYILSDIDKNIFLSACAGSGKTEVLGIKSAYEIKRWEKENQGIAILTFTNSAEDEIRNRVEGFLHFNIGYPHFLGTFTSWIHGYIANPFSSYITKYKGDENGDKSIKLIDSKSNSKFLKVYSTKYSYDKLGNMRANEFYYYLKEDKYAYCGDRNREGQSILDGLISEQSWRIDDLIKTKNKFFKSGYCTYEDVENIVYSILKEKDDIAKIFSRRFPVILVDECQDLSYMQLEILKCLSEQGSKLHFIGDLDQSIYEFRKIHPEDTKKFIKELEFCELELNKNYRSCQEIVNISNLIINKTDKIEGFKYVEIKDKLIVILYKKNQEKLVVEKFYDLIKKNKLNCENSRVIVRNNRLKNKLLGLKNNQGSENILEDLIKAIYLCKEYSNINNYRDGFILLCKVIQKIYFNNDEHKNKNYFYMPLSLEIKIWENLVYNIGNELINNEDLFNFDLTFKEWKNLLKNILENDLKYINEIDGKKINLGKIRSGNSLKKINEIIFSNNDNCLDHKIETIHGCKGMSLDAVLFMSSYKRPSLTSREEPSGSYWREWFDTNQIEEKNRMAYVAFSRAKYFLALGIPKPSSFSDSDRNKLMDYGFKLIEI